MDICRGITRCPHMRERRHPQGCYRISWGSCARPYHAVARILGHASVQRNPQI